MIRKGGQSPLRKPLLMLTVLVLIGTLAGCAKTGPVRPKLTSLPASPQEARLVQRGDHLLLSWEAPARNQDGSAAEDLAGFRILRSDFAAADGCPECREPDDLRARIRRASPAPARRIGDRFYWLDEQVEIGRGYRYVIVPVTVGGQRGTPADLRALLTPPLAAPTGLSIRREPGRLHLSWQAPDLAPEMEQLGYNLYRRRIGQTWSPAPLNPQPLSATTLVDIVAADSRDYEYRVSILVNMAGIVRESRLSDSLSSAVSRP
ncbi:MAG: hypothetical protein RQ723_08065 [Desulfuromonadales bacterium]|nr:hypothetical protein [Desulfuromonadales bacterium]